MLWSKIGRPILRKVDNSRLLLWFITRKVEKVICGNCWHLLRGSKGVKSICRLCFY